MHRNKRASKGQTKKDAAEKKRNLNSEPQLNRRKVNRKVKSTKATSSCENDVEENNACACNCGFTYMGNKMTHWLMTIEWFKYVLTVQNGANSHCYCYGARWRTHGARWLSYRASCPHMGGQDDEFWYSVNLEFKKLWLQSWTWVKFHSLGHHDVHRLIKCLVKSEKI